MKNLFFLFSFVLFWTGIVHAQNQEYCYTDYLIEQSLQNPAKNSMHNDLENDIIQRTIAQQSQQGLLDEDQLTIHVAVHIVHRQEDIIGSNSNISDEDVYSAIQGLNEAYANTIFDMGSIDTNIDFCLATENSLGEETTGINRYADNDLTIANTSSGNSNDLLMKITTAPIDEWSRFNYLNIWVVSDIINYSLPGVSVTGYAYPPIEHGSPVDGVVVRFNYMTGSSAGSRLLSHEVGHYFNLLHTFGSILNWQGDCTNDNCLTDNDRVCDTPPDGALFDCSVTNYCDTDTNSGSATDENDPNENYMTYSNLQCESQFTMGQRTRMRLSLIDDLTQESGPRYSLITNSLECCPIGTIQAEFDYSVMDNMVDFNVTNIVGNINSYSWNFGDNSSLETGTNPQHEFLEAGVYEVCLQIIGVDEECSNYYCRDVIIDYSDSDCNLICNPLMLTTEPELLFCNVFVWEDDEDDLSCWTGAGGSPQYSTVNLDGVGGSAYCVADIVSATWQFEGIKAITTTLEANEKYIFSMHFRQLHPTRRVSSRILLDRDTNNDGEGDALFISNECPSGALGSSAPVDFNTEGTFLIFQSPPEGDNTTFSRRIVCFSTDGEENIKDVFIYPSGTEDPFEPGTMGLRYTNVELVKDNFTAGEDQSFICPQEVTIGGGTCTLSGTTLYSLTNMTTGEVLVEVSETPVFNVFVEETTTFKVSRLFDTDFHNCELSDLEDFVTITIDQPIVSAEFTYEPENCGINFSSEAQNSSQTWNFGDESNLSSELNPYHPYEEGIYTVTHTVFDACGNSDTHTEIIEIECISTPPDCCSADIISIEGDYTLSQAIAEGLLLDSPANIFTSQTIFIDGILTIDQAYRFSNGSEICMGSGAAINVDSGVSFTIEGTHIHGCQQMWQGIILADNAHIGAFYSTIEDAATAIQSGAKSQVGARSCVFRKNMIGILHPPGLSHSASFRLWDNNFNCTQVNLLPTYPDQQGEIGNVSYAGIVINDNATTLSGIPNPNVIQDMPNGIICNNATLNVRNFRFQNIHRYELYDTEGYGIISRGHGEKLTQLGLGQDNIPTFDNCLYGIYAQDISVDISENFMDNVIRGIIHRIAQTRSIEIQDNKINTESTGIGLVNTDKADLIRIQNNIVSLDNSGSANACIWVSELAMGQDEIATIQLNTLYVNTKGSGIRMNSTKSYSLIDNTITISPSNPGRGINIRGSKGLTVSCNDIIGSTTANHIGINALSSPSCDFHSNKVTTLETGIRFQGTCNGTDLKTNIFDSNDVSLHLTGTSIFGINEDPNTGVQTHRGNKWIGGNSDDVDINKGQHDGTDENIVLSQFIVHDADIPTNPTEDNPSFVPYTIVSAGAWFVPQLGTPAGSNSDDCLPKIFQGKATNIDKEIAKENIEIEFYNEQVLWVTKKELYRKLDEDPSQINGDADLQNFYDAKSSESIGLLHDVEKNSKAIHYVDNSTKGQMESLRNSIESHLQQLKSLEATLPEEPTDADLLDLSAAQSLIYEELKIAEEQLKVLNQNLRLGKEGTANANSVQNNSIYVMEIYEQNEKAVNNIYLATVAKGNDDFTSSQISELWIIASECPLAGGNAVFKARTLYAMIDSEQTFDDDDICNAAGIVLNVRPNGETAAMTNEARTGLGDASGLEETSSSSEQADEEKFSFSLSPNPASDEIRLNIGSSTPLEGVIRFYDLRGRLISEQIISTGTSALVIDITDWSDGIYFAKMTFNNGNITTKKVSVVH